MERKKALIVSKFGGSSMKDSTCIKRNAELALKRKSSLVVVSAIFGATDELFKVAREALSSLGSAKKRLQNLQERHLSLAWEMECPAPTKEAIQALFCEASVLTQGISLLKDVSPKTLDSLLSTGEKASAQLMLAAMNHLQKVSHLDARKVIRTNADFSKAKPNLQKIHLLAQEHISPFLQKGIPLVTEGFIGATEEGFTTTLGREGSDYSAALFARAVSADLLEIWTDVPGIFTTDPALCPKARPLPEISFPEAFELASFGAKVLHPSTLIPIAPLGIPLFVGSSSNPEGGSTWIRPHSSTSPFIRGMTMRNLQTLLTIRNPKMLNAHGFLASIFRVFADHKISIDAISTSEISLALTLDPESLRPSLLKDLESKAEIHREDNLALVSLIGNHINKTPGLALRTFRCLNQAPSPINVRLISQGASPYNFCLAVLESDASRAIERLHQEFIP